MGKAVMALTICNPYPELILRGEKPFENREWPTSYRGPLVIHAGKSRAWLDPGDEKRFPALVFGAFVGVVDMVDCRRVGDLTREQQQNEHANGPWCHVYANPRRLAAPIPYRGAQGLWRVPDDLLHQLGLGVSSPAVREE